MTIARRLQHVEERQFQRALNERRLQRGPINHLLRNDPHFAGLMRRLEELIETCPSEAPPDYPLSRLDRALIEDDSPNPNAVELERSRTLIWRAHQVIQRGEGRRLMNEAVTILDTYLRCDDAT